MKYFAIYKELQFNDVLIFNKINLYVYGFSKNIHNVLESITKENYEAVLKYLDERKCYNKKISLNLGNCEDDNRLNILIKYLSMINKETLNKKGFINNFFINRKALDSLKYALKNINSDDALKRPIIEENNDNFIIIQDILNNHYFKFNKEDKILFSLKINNGKIDFINLKDNINEKMLKLIDKKFFKKSKTNNYLIMD